MYICTRCADLLCTGPTIHLMVAVLKILLQSMPLFGCFHAVCNSTRLSQSFQLVQGKTQDYCRLSENIYRFVKNTLIYNTMSTNNSVHWPRSLTGINKLRPQNKHTTWFESKLLLSSHGWSHFWAFERILLSYWSAQSLKSGHKKWEKKVYNNGYVWTRLTHSLPFTI